MDAYGIWVLTEYRLYVIFYVLCCGLAIILWSFEITISGEPFTIESPMIRMFFLSLITFYSLCGTFILLGSWFTFSLTTPTSGFFLLDFYKLLLEFCKSLSTRELLFSIFNIILLFWSIWCCKKLFWFNRKEFRFFIKIILCL